MIIENEVLGSIRIVPNTSVCQFFTLKKMDKTYRRQFSLQMIFKDEVLGSIRIVPNTSVCQFFTLKKMDKTYRRQFSLQMIFKDEVLGSIRIDRILQYVHFYFKENGQDLWSAFFSANDN